MTARKVSKPVDGMREKQKTRVAKERDEANSKTSVSV